MSPLLVLTIHGLVVADIVIHRPQLQVVDDAWSALLWLLVCLTVTVYLQASLTDPGWMRPKPYTFASPLSCLACPALVCGALATCGIWPREPKQPGAEGPAAPGAGSNTHAAVAGESPAETSVELQPILPSSDGGSPQASPPTMGGCLEPQTALDLEAGGGGDAAAGEATLKRRGGAEEKGTASQVAVLADESANGASDLRWCKTCKLYQPLRTKHCRDCGVCVRTHDHHCPWIGTCVGENNRGLFYCFLCCQDVELVLFFIEGVRAMSLRDPSVMLMVGLLVIGMFVLMVTCLLSFHTFLMVANLTTWEHSSWNKITYLKPFVRDRGSPFSRSLSGNVVAYFFGPRWCPERLRRVSAVKRGDMECVDWEAVEPRPWGCCMQCCADSC